jgi:hypothetical protein
VNGFTEFKYFSPIGLDLTAKWDRIPIIRRGKKFPLRADSSNMLLITIINRCHSLRGHTS